MLTSTILKDVADFERIWAKNAFFAQDWLDFNNIYLFGFLSLNSDQVMKKHLLDRENRFARTIWARAETAPPPALSQKSDQNHILLMHVFWRAQRAQPRARPCSARQSIFLIKEMLFHYLIAI